MKSLHSEIDTNSEIDRDGAVPQQSPPSASGRLGEYLLHRRLGTGAFGVVYEATHIKHQTKVALKTLRIDSGQSPETQGAAQRLHKFRREFRALAENKPSQPCRLAGDGARPREVVFTMDMIDGIDLLSYVRPQGELDETRLRAILPQVMAGIVALHNRRIVHRDLKPSNIMVDKAGRAIILDFGLVSESGTQHTISSIGFQGTPAYAAPEQLHGKCTSHSDWYAFGTILYEAMTGRRPYRGDDPTALMLLKSQQEPLSIVGNPNFPEDLASLAMQLLDSDPGQRPEAPEIAKVLSDGDSAIQLTHARNDEQFVGRSDHLELLKSTQQTLVDTQSPVAAFVVGRSGEGKSFLVEQFLTPLRHDLRFTVLTGRCYDRESVPFKALDSLIDALCTHIGKLKPEDAYRILPDDIRILANLFPVMMRVPVVAQSPKININIGEQQMRQRGFEALRKLLWRISEQTPVVMFIDDLQWGDADSARAMFEILRPPEAPVVLFLGSFRSDETENSAFLNEWWKLQEESGIQLPHQEVKVAPLSSGQCTEMVIAHVGADTPEVRKQAQTLYEESGGNPFFLGELLDCFDPQQPALEKVPLNELIDLKLQGLPDDSAQLLDVIAVSGQAIRLTEVSACIGHASPAFATITRMRSERLVRLIGSGDDALVDTYHDKIRENVLARLAEHDRRELHQQLAETIELGISTPTSPADDQHTSDETGQDESVSDRMYDLAYHFDAAGSSERALTYAVLAAEQARARFALEVATQQYAIADRNSNQVSPDVRYQISVGWGQTLMLLGRYAEAAGKLEDADSWVEDPERKAQVELLRGQIAFKTGRMQESISNYESGLRRLGTWVPRTLIGYAFGLLGSCIVQAYHSLFRFRLHRQTPRTRDLLRVELLNRLGNAYCWSTTTLKMFWALIKATNCGERYPPSAVLVFSYSFLSGAMAIIGWPSRGKKLKDRAMQYAEQLDDEWGRAHASAWAGMAAYTQGSYEEGIKLITQGVERFERTGDPWEINLAKFHQGCCEYRLGQLDLATQTAQETFESSVNTDDARANCALYLWSKAASGVLEYQSHEKQIIPVPEDLLSTFHLIMGEGYWQLAQGAPDKAVEAFRNAANQTLRNLLINFHTITAVPWQVTAMRLHAEFTHETDPDAARKLFRDAFSLAWKTAWLTYFFPPDYPHAMRELALSYRQRGALRKAQRAAQKSCHAARQHQAQLELAQSLHALALISAELDLPEATDLRREAEQTATEFSDIAASKIYYLPQPT